MDALPYMDGRAPIYGWMCSTATDVLPYMNRYALFPSIVNTLNLPAQSGARWCPPNDLLL